MSHPLPDPPKQPDCGCMIHGEDPLQCDPLCARLGCADAPGHAMHAAVLRDLAEQAWRNATLHPVRSPFKVIEPELSPSAIRAYALLAAANMLAGSAGAHPHESTIAGWEDRVLKTAARFARYIEGSENPSS